MNKAKCTKWRPQLSYERKKSLVGWAFITPWLLGAAVFFLVPMIQSVLYSFGKINLTDTGFHLSLVGFANYSEIFNNDPYFIPLSTESFVAMLRNTPIIVIFSLFIALLLNQKFVGRTMFRGMFFLPVIIANGVIIGIITGDSMSDFVMSSASASQMFSVDFLKNLLSEAGVCTSFITSLTSMVDSLFELIWRTGVQILIFLAGLQTVSTAMYEAAKIEGATGWETFWKVTFPMVSPMILLNVIYTIIDQFTDSSNRIMVYIQRQTQDMKLEVGAAMSWIYYLAVMLVLAIVYVLINRHIFYDE